MVLLLETMLAFADKAALLREVSRALPVGGRFALTLEEGDPLTDAERRAMPDADTVWLTPLAELVELLGQVGLRVTWQRECTESHLGMVESLLDAFSLQQNEIAEQLGRPALDELLAAHRLWSEWLSSGRVRKFALVAQKAQSRRCT